MRFVLRQSWREISNSRSFCLFYCLNLSFGLIALLVVDAFRHSIEEKVAVESKELLGADLAMRARRPLSNVELELAQSVLPSESQSLDVVDFYSMAAGPTGRTRLVKVIAMDEGFPFYGGFKLRVGGSHPGDRKALIHQKPLTWIHPELRAQLEIDLGDELLLGEGRFLVSDWVKEHSGLAFQPTDLAPKVFIGRNFLDQTNLLGRGNLAFHNRLFKLPEGSDSETCSEKMESVLQSPELRIYSHQQAGHRAGRLLRYLSDFLSLVSLVAFFLACLGSGFLFHGFLAHRLPELAAMIALGASRLTAVSIFLTQLLLLGIFSVLPAVLLCSVFLPILSELVSQFATIKIRVFLGLESLALALGTAILSGLLLCLPSLSKVFSLCPADLFREAARPGSGGTFRGSLLLLPGIFAFWGLCQYLSHSEKLGQVFFFSLLLSISVLFLVSSRGFGWLAKALERTSPSFRLAARSLARDRAGSTTGFLALGAGVLLLTLVPQTKYALEKEIGLDDRESKLPDLFLFDLQEEQLSPLRSFLENEGIFMENLTPWVRGKIISLKGAPYEKSPAADRESSNPEDQRRQAFRNRSFNLSYGEDPLTGETIIAGRPFQGSYDPLKKKPVEISLEHKYAEALDLGVGDHMELEVAGVFIEAKVVNLRRVRWTSFRPNFFARMQPGVLEGAPKTFLGTLSSLNAEEREKAQNSLVKEFPTISILDVKRTGKRILEVVAQMTWVLQLMAALSLFAGIIVLFCVVRQKAKSRRWEINLQRTLGCPSNRLRRQSRFEFILLGFAASALGSGLSVFASYLLSAQVFDRVWDFRWDLPFICILGICFLCALIAELGTRSVLRQSPGMLLRDNQEFGG